jgi:hypothetical protein
MSLRKECIVSGRSALTESGSIQSLEEITWNLYAECAYPPQGVHQKSMRTISSINFS